MFCARSGTGVIRRVHCAADSGTGTSAFAIVAVRRCRFPSAQNLLLAWSAVIQPRVGQSTQSGHAGPDRAEVAAETAASSAALHRGARVALVCETERCGTGAEIVRNWCGSRAERLRNAGGSTTRRPLWCAVGLSRVSSLCGADARTTHHAPGKFLAPAPARPARPATTPPPQTPLPHTERRRAEEELGACPRASKLFAAAEEGAHHGHHTPQEARRTSVLSSFAVIVATSLVRVWDARVGSDVIKTNRGLLPPT